MIRFARPCVLVLSILALAVWAGCQKPSTESGDAESSQAKQDSSGAGKAANRGTLTNPQEILEKMAAVYRTASSYQDFGEFRALAETDKRKVDQKLNFAVAFTRPNKLRMHFCDGNIVSNGQKWHAFAGGLPGQVVQRDAPATITFASLGADLLLAESLVQGFGAPSPQMLLLVGEEPLKTLQAGATETTLAEPGKIGEDQCYRVQLRRPDGTVVLWIDQQSYVLRRMVFPTDEFRRDLERDGPVKNLSIIADFDRAHVNGEIDPATYEFEIPKDARLTRFLVEPPGPFQLIGKKVDEFKFLDLKGGAVTPQSLAGKIAVFEFWATNCDPCRVTLPNIEGVYRKYADNDKVMFVAVCLDPPDTPAKTVEEKAQELKLTLPVLRDPDQQARNAFSVTGPPTTVVLDARGVIQDCHMGDDPSFAAALAQKIEKLLAGEDLSKATIARYEERMKQYGIGVDERFQGKAPEEFKAAIAPASQPAKFRLERMWKSDEVKSPGNVLVVPRPGGPPQLLVVDEWKSVAEVGPDGKLLARHSPEIDKDELICSLRTAAGSDGKRRFAAFATGHQRFHLLDDQWKLLFSFPAGALKNPHSGIADVELGDLQGDGKTKAYVGYWGVIGVQEVGLDGEKTWTNRALVSVTRMAVTGPDSGGKRELLCANESGSLAVLDAKGQMRTNISVPNHLMGWIVGADLKGDGKLLWTAIARGEQRIAIGLNLEGELLWSYALPKGGLQQPIEQIVPGRLTASGPGQWLLPGSDGSIHVLSADGKPLDQFNHGAILGGLATMEVDGKPVLVIASEKGLEAFRVSE